MSSQTHSSVSIRAIVLGLCMVLLVCAIVSYAELVIADIQIGFLQFPPVVIGLFFFLVLVNQPVFIKRFVLTPQELILIYCMMVIASMISSRGLMEKLLPALVSVNYFANPTNNWAELFFPHIRPWMVPFDTQILGPQSISIDFYHQISDTGLITWRKWLRPMLVWGGLTVLIFGAYLCLAIILRRQWVENEKLTFPLTQLPVEFVDSESSFFFQPYVWIGVALPTIVFSLNGLNQIFPQIPSIPLRYSLNTYFTEKPWQAISYTPMFVSFAATGFFYLLPSQLLFSLWFFFLFTRLQDVIASVFGLRVSSMPLYPTHLHMGYQVMGSYCVLVITYIYTGWPYLRQVLDSQLLKKNRSSDNSITLAVWGLTFSLLGAMIWLVWAGMSPLLAILEIGVVVGLVSIVMARSTAEAGMLMTETSFRPIDFYQLFSTKSSLGAKNLTVLSFFDTIFARDFRGLVLTGFLDGLKISRNIRLKQSWLLVALGLTVLIAFCFGAMIQIYLPYKFGANYMYSYAYSGNSIWAFRDAVPSIEGFDSEYNMTVLVFFILGSVITSLLVFCRYLYWWWPLQPLGYALSASWTLIVFWLPIMLAWLLKSFVLRIGGIQKYRQFRPFFMGLVLGEFSMAIVWTAISYFLRVPAPFFPWP